MKFIENNTYTIQTDYYNTVKVVCTYVEDNTIYFQYTGSTSSFHDYKLNQKTNKLYVWNSKFSSCDSIENTLYEDTVKDVWSERIGNGSGYYSGVGQD